MGHYIGEGFLKATNEKDAVREGYNRAVDFAFYEGDREEGSDNYNNYFAYHDKTFETEDDALAWFHSQGSYFDGVVRVKHLSESTRTRYNTRIHRWRSKRNKIIWDYIKKFKQRKSATISCRYCGHRHTKEEALSNDLYCMSCHKRILPDGVLNRMQKCQEHISMIENDYYQDLKENGDYRYYCKYEIHC